MSVFNKCSVKYKKVEGNSYLSTYNRLRAYNFVDQYLNVKTDVATWRKARAELNELASAKLGQKVNLFGERKLLNGIQAVPDMKLFGMLDYMNKNGITNYQPQLIRDEIGIDEFGDSDTNFLPEAETEAIEDRIYKSLGVPKFSVIKMDQVQGVTEQIKSFNELNTGKVLSLQPVRTGYLLKTEYNVKYLYQNIPTPIDNTPDRLDTNSNNNFNKSCIL